MEIARRGEFTEDNDTADRKFSQGEKTNTYFNMPQVSFTVQSDALLPLPDWEEERAEY